MSAVVFLLVCFLSCSVSGDPKLHVITAKPGDDVTLPCKAPNNVKIEIVEWTRSDLERFVYLKRYRNLVTADQDPSYVNRVQLKDDEMKNGDLSLILKNVNNNDNGTYKCRYEKEGEGDAQMKLISIVVLNAKEQTVKSGDDVTLHCQSPKHEAITSIQWIRSDLKIEKYVFFRNGRPNKDLQHPSFHGRVQLKDGEMKNGDVSVILKNVNTNDSGTYECRVSVNNKQSELMNIINLKVKDSGETSGNTQTEGEKEGGKKDRNHGLPVTVGILLLVAVVGFVIYKRHKRRSDQPGHYTAAVPQQDIELSDELN